MYQRKLTCVVEWFVLCSIFLATGCRSLPQIEQRPITFDSTRTTLTLQYLEEHYGIQQQQPTISPQMIVVHWTVVPSFEETFKVFNPPTLRNTRPDINRAGALNVSAHYLVGREGRVAQLLPDTVMARHVIGLNYTAIGIENVGGPEHPLTGDQLQANARLIRRLVKKYDIKYLIGHYEYQRFEDYPLWKEKDSDYRTEKNDPGNKFMKRLRHKLEDLDLKGAPDAEP